MTDEANPRPDPSASPASHDRSPRAAEPIWVDRTWVPDDQFRAEWARFRSAGGRIENSTKRWYIPAGADLARFTPWLSPSPVAVDATAEGLTAYWRETLLFSSLDDLDGGDPVQRGIEFGHLDQGRLVGLGAKFLEAVRTLGERGRRGDDDGALGAGPILLLFGYRRSPRPGQWTSHILCAVPARLAPDGALAGVAGQHPVFSRRYFEDRAHGRAAWRPTLGPEGDLEAALANLPPPDGEDWATCWAHANRVFAAAARSRRPGVDHLRGFKGDCGRPLLVSAVPFGLNDARNRDLAALYRTLAQAPEGAAPLYGTLQRPPEARAPLGLGSLARVAERQFGHMDAAHGLDPSQREVVLHLLATPDGRLLAADGPPGTGKTSVLKAITASLVVEKTLASPHPEPPLILASSATNQATTNVIRAFGAVADPIGAETVYSRWIEGAPSYGWFFPSASSAHKEDYREFQHLKRDRYDNRWTYDAGAAELESARRDPQALAARRDGFLRRYRKNFPGRPAASLADAVAQLHRELGQVAGVGRDGLPGVAAFARQAARALELLAEAGVERRLTAERWLERRRQGASRAAARIAGLKARAKAVEEELLLLEDARHRAEPPGPGLWARLCG